MKTVTFDSPIVAQTELTEAGVLAVNVDLVNKRITAVFDTQPRQKSAVLASGEAEYAASNVEAFWPWVEATVKAKAANGTLFK